MALRVWIAGVVGFVVGALAMVLPVPVTKLILWLAAKRRTD